VAKRRFYKATAIAQAKPSAIELPIRLEEHLRTQSVSKEMTMPERTLRVLKWLSATPAIGVCTRTREFKVPMSALTRTADAQVNLQQQFDRHKCEGRDSAKERKTE